MLDFLKVEKREAVTVILRTNVETIFCGRGPYKKTLNPKKKTTTTGSESTVQQLVKMPYTFCVKMRVPRKSKERLSSDIFFRPRDIPKILRHQKQ